MTQPLDPEIKALKALLRAMEPLDAKARHRAIEWYAASQANLPWISLPAFEGRSNVRPLREADSA